MKNKPSELFEGKNSSLYKVFTEIKDKPISLLGKGLKVVVKKGKHMIIKNDK